MNFKYPPLVALDHLLPFVAQGKTRETYELPPRTTGGETAELLLIVASNRLSTHNVVHKSPIPRKGEVLTALSIFWFDKMNIAGLPHHLVAFGKNIYKYLPGKRSDYPEGLHLVAIVVRKLTIIEVELIYRNRVAGSLWANYDRKSKSKRNYKRIRDPYGHKHPRGLKLMSKFDEPLFTPTRKSKKDEPINAEETRHRYPQAYALGLNAFGETGRRLQESGIELIDAKGEVGVDRHGNHYLADEWGTLDCSRLVHPSDVCEGLEPQWLDKEPARQEAKRRWETKKRKYPLTFEPDVIGTLSDRYLNTFPKITGSPLDVFQQVEY